MGGVQSARVRLKTRGLEIVAPLKNVPWSHETAITLPVSRGRALTRSVIWAAPAVVGIAVTLVIYPNLDLFAVNGVNRLVAWSAAIAALPIPIALTICGFKSVRYLALSVWPGRVGVHADSRNLVLALGPFGTRRFDAARLDARYPFEQSKDEAVEDGFEAYLPQEEQMARFVPRMTHPDATEPIHRTLLRFCKGDEIDIASKLQPVLAVWRGEQTTSDGQGNGDDA